MNRKNIGFILWAITLLMLWVILTSKAHGQVVTGTGLSIGTPPTPPGSSSPVRIVGIPGTTNGVLDTNGTGDLVRRFAVKLDLPASIAYEDEGNIFTANQTISGAFDLVVGTGGIRGPAGTGVRIDNTGNTGVWVAQFANTAITLSQPTAITGDSSVTGTWVVTGLSTLTGGFTAGAASQVNSTLGVTGLSTLTGGFTAGAASTVNSTLGITGLTTAAKIKTTGIYAVAAPLLFRNSTDAATVMSMADTGLDLTGTLGVSGLSTLTGGFNSNAASAVNSTLNITGLTTAAKIRTTGVYGVASPFNIFATDGVTPRVQVADNGPLVLTDTGTDAYIRYAASGNTTGQRQWRAGNITGNFVIGGGDDAATTWSTLARGTETDGIANGWFWGEAVTNVDPLLSYETSLGNDIYKYLSLSAAELRVGTIVAQDYIATIGGRVMVGPTTQLTEDLTDTDTQIFVKHNEMASGDRVYMEGGGKVEFMAVTSGPTDMSGGGTVSSIVRTGVAGGVTTATIPTHVAGDILVLISLRIGSNSPPTAGTSTGGGTWLNVCSGGSDSTSYRVAYLVATSAAETTGTWSGATHLFVMVYQGLTSPYFGACASTGIAGGSVATLTYPALTLTDSDGSSFILRAGTVNNATNVETLPPTSSYSLVLDLDDTRDSALWTSTSGQTTVVQDNVTTNAVSATRGLSLELLGTITTGTPTGAGPFRYDVTRNLDGSSINFWYKGDAIFNTGTTGDGFWDIYSIQSVKGGSERGPTQCANVRTGTTYNAWAPRFCSGNLYGLYGNPASNVYGTAFGDYTDVWGQIDTTNGFRFFEGSTNQKLRIDPSGYVLIGTAGSGQANTYIDNTALKMRRGTVEHAVLDATGLLLGTVGTGEENALITSTSWAMREGTTKRMELTGGTFRFYDSGGVNYPVELTGTPGTGTFGYRHLGATYANLFINGATGALEIAQGTKTRMSLVGDTLTIFRSGGTAAITLNSTDGATFVGDGGGVTNINGGNIQTSTITATQIAAGAITADDLAVGLSSDNLIMNGNFEETYAGWRCVESAGIACQAGGVTTAGGWHISTSGVEGAYTAVVAYTPTPGIGMAIGSRAVPIDDRSTYFVRLSVYSSVASATGLYVRMNEADATIPTPMWLGNGGYSGVTNRTGLKDLIGNGSHPGGYVTHELLYTPTAGTKFASLAVYNWTCVSGGGTCGYMLLDGVQMIKKTGNLSALSASMGTIDILTGGHVKSGTALPSGSGDGFWLGRDSDTLSKFYIGNWNGSTGNYLYWNGSGLSMVGNLSSPGYWSLGQTSGLNFVQTDANFSIARGVNFGTSGAWGSLFSIKQTGYPEIYMQGGGGGRAIVDGPAVAILQGSTAIVRTPTGVTSTAIEVQATDIKIGVTGSGIATTMSPYFDGQVTLGTSAKRYKTINMDLPNNPTPKFVLVNKGCGTSGGSGCGGDEDSAVGYYFALGSVTPVNIYMRKWDNSGSCYISVVTGLVFFTTCPSP